MVTRRYDVTTSLGRRRVAEVLRAALAHTWAGLKCRVLGHRFPQPAGWCTRCEGAHNEGY